MNEMETKARDNRNQNESELGQPIPHAATSMRIALSPVNASLRALRAEAEIHAISRALERTGWNRKQAARLLSISYRGLLYKIRQHNITPDSGEPLSSFAEQVKAG